MYDEVEEVTTYLRIWYVYQSLAHGKLIYKPGERKSVGKSCQPLQEFILVGRVSKHKPDAESWTNISDTDGYGDEPQACRAHAAFAHKYTPKLCELS